MRPPVLYDYEGVPEIVPDRTHFELMEAYDHVKRAREHALNALNALPAKTIVIGSLLSDIYSCLADDMTNIRCMLEGEE